MKLPEFLYKFKEESALKYTQNAEQQKYHIQKITAVNNWYRTTMNK